MSPKRESFTLEHDGKKLTTAHASQPFSLLKWTGEIEKSGASFLVADLAAAALKKETALFSSLLRKTERHAQVLTGNFKKNLL